MHPTQSVTLVHDRHHTLRAAAPARSARFDRAERSRSGLLAPIHAAWASARRAVADRRSVRGLVTHPSDC